MIEAGLDDDFECDNFKILGDPLIDIPRLIAWRGNGLSFVELLNYLPYLKGELSICWSFENIILWQGVSDDCVKACGALLRNKTICLEDASLLTYILDGVVPKLAQADSMRSYKTKRWMPSTLSLTPIGKTQFAG